MARIDLKVTGEYKFTERNTFNSREVDLPQDVVDAVTKVISDYRTVQNWLSAVYQGANRRDYVALPLPDQIQEILWADAPRPEEEQPKQPDSAPASNSTSGKRRKKTGSKASSTSQTDSSSSGSPSPGSTSPTGDSPTES